MLERLPYGKKESLISRIMMRNLVGQSMFQCCIVFTYVRYITQDTAVLP